MEGPPIGKDYFSFEVFSKRKFGNVEPHLSSSVLLLNIQLVLGHHLFVQSF